MTMGMSHFISVPRKFHGKCLDPISVFHFVLNHSFKVIYNKNVFVVFTATDFELLVLVLDVYDQ